jgi:tetratricopeptide (TPR) repeat protein
VKPVAVALLWLASNASLALDVDALWNYADPVASEARFRAALTGAQGDDALVLRSQIARTLSLRRRFDEAHAELDAIEPALAGAGIEPRVRASLERGRTLRSAGQPLEARSLFQRAFVTADAGKLEVLAADALHMLALAALELDERIAWNRRTIDYAQRASDPRARRWAAPALNNLGSDLRGAGRLEESLATFREALVGYERGASAASVRFARWQVANVLRLMGRTDEALTMQIALERENGAVGTPDAHVYDEISLLHAARGDAAAARRAEARAKEVRDGDRR